MVAVCDFRLFPRTSVLKYCFKARWFARCFQFPTPLLFGFKRILQTLAVTVVQVTWSSISQIVVSSPGWLVSDSLSRQPEVTPRFFGQSKDMSLEDVIKSKGLVFALDWNQVKLYKSLDIRNAKCFQELSNCHEISISPPFFYKTCGLPINACQVDYAGGNSKRPTRGTKVEYSDRVDGCWWTKSREAVEVGSRSMFLLLLFLGSFYIQAGVGIPPLDQQRYT